MTTDLRNYVLRLNGSVDFETETCFKCGVLFAMTSDYRNNRRRKRDTFFCPNGHSQHYVGKTDTEKLKEAQARETALRDQLAAATRDAELTRVALLRDRARFAAGACPCCNRTFENVRRHMSTQHPDYDVTRIAKKGVKFECSCGASFETLRGLRTHQGHMRGPNWDSPKTEPWRAHLTEVGTR